LAGYRRDIKPMRSHRFDHGRSTPECHPVPATEPVSPSPSARPTASIGSWWILGLVCAAQFMVVLDVSVVNVALPSIRTALGFDPVDLQWVAGSYALTFAGLLLLGG